MSSIQQIITGIVNERDICISLILTYKCPYECEHCMYGCSPRMSRAYMSRHTLYTMRSWTQDFESYGFRPRLNLIGGEPTINLEKFKWALIVLGTDIQDYADLEMTTNGWWLEKAKTAHVFFEAIKPFVSEYPDEGISVRVSDDKYHRQFHHRFDSFKKIIDYSFTDEQYGYFDYAGYDEDECLPEMNHKEYPWLYAEDDLDDQGVCPSGVRGQWGMADYGADKRCITGDRIGITPLGKMSDGCGCGSHMPFGDIHDDPLVLLALSKYFKTHVREKDSSCMDCRELAVRFRRTKEFRQVKQEAYNFIRSEEFQDGIGR